MKSFLLRLLLCLVCISCPAATYYVDFDSGVDSNNGTSTSTPWRTLPGTRNVGNSAFLNSAWGSITTSAKIQSGDTIKLKRGTTYSAADGGGIIQIDSNYYTDGLTNSYGAITIEPDDSWGTGDVTFAFGGFSWAAVENAGAFYIRLDGLKLAGTATNPIYMGGFTNTLVAVYEKQAGGRNYKLELANLVMTNFCSGLLSDTAAAARGAIWVRFADGVKIHNLSIDNTAAISGSGGFGNGMVLGDDFMTIQNALVYSNVIQNLKGDTTDDDAGIGVKFFNGQAELYWNYVRNCLKGMDLGEQRATNTYQISYKAFNNTIISNIWGLNWNNSGASATATNFGSYYAWNNLIVSNAYKGMNIYGGPWKGYIAHNTFAYNGPAFPDAYGGTDIHVSHNSGSGEYGGSVGINLTTRNNIFFRGYDAVFSNGYYNDTNNNLTVDFDYNVYVKASSSSVFFNWAYFTSGSAVNIGWGAPWTPGDITAQWYTYKSKYAHNPAGGGNGHYHSDANSTIILDASGRNSDSFFNNFTSLVPAAYDDGVSLSGQSWYDSRMGLDRNGLTRTLWSAGVWEDPSGSSSESGGYSGTFYVGPSGSAANAGTNAAAPWPIEYAFQRPLNHNSVLYLLSGSYSGTNDSGRSNTKTLYWNATASSASTSFTNSAAITIPASGQATPSYPSTITVSGVSGASDVKVKLFGFSHTDPTDVEILLVGPNGANVVLMSDGFTGTDASSLNINFQDSGVAIGAYTITNGTYAPADTAPTGDAYYSPAPSAPFGTTLAALLSGGANGDWSLYVQDDSGGDSGSIGSGWALEFVTSSGSGTNLVYVKPYRGARAVIDVQQVVLSTSSSSSSPIFDGLEFTTLAISNAPANMNSGSGQTELFQGGSTLTRTHAELRNCLIYNVGQVNGNVFNKMVGNHISFAGRSPYQHIWYGGDYTIPRTITHNVVGWNSGDAFKLVGAVNNTVSSNIVIYPGALVHPTNALWLGNQWALVEQADSGQTSYSGNIYKGNYFVQNESSVADQSCVHLGYGLAGNTSMQFIGNFVSGGNSGVPVIKFGTASDNGDYSNSQVTDNYFYLPYSSSYQVMEMTRIWGSGNVFNTNFYAKANPPPTFSLTNGVISFASWKANTGFDANSSSTFPGAGVISNYFRNPYTTNRASFVYHDLNGDTTRSIDLSQAGFVANRNVLFIFAGSPSRTYWQTNLYDGSVFTIATTTNTWPLETPGYHTNNSTLSYNPRRVAAWTLIQSPPAPVMDIPIRSSSTNITITWTAPEADNYNKFIIKRSTTIPATTYTIIATNEYNVTTYTDTSTAATNNYTYAVSAVSDYLQSPYSETSITADTTPTSDWGWKLWMRRWFRK